MSIAIIVGLHTKLLLFIEVSKKEKKYKNLHFREEIIFDSKTAHWHWSNLTDRIRIFDFDF